MSFLYLEARKGILRRYTLIALALFLWPVQIMDLMSNKHHLSLLGAPYLRVIGFSYVFNMLSSIYVSAQRSVENAESSLSQANDAYSQAQASAALTAQSNAAEAEALRLEKEKNDEKIDLLASLVEAGGLVSAPRSTLLTVCDLEQGQPCPEGECLQLAKEDSEMLVRFTLPAEQAEKITAGLAIAVTQGSASAEAAVRTVETDEEKQTGLVTAVLDETAAGFKAGAARAELVFSRNAYELCLPVSALRQDGQGSYVLAVEETKNAFGLSLTALRVPVTVKEVDSDGQYAAVEGSIGGGVIVSSNRAVSPGASVRMEE